MTIYKVRLRAVHVKGATVTYEGRETSRCLSGGRGAMVLTFGAEFVTG